MKKIAKIVYCFIFIFMLQLVFSVPSFAASNNPIKNGWYMIQSGNASNRVLDINNNSLINGGNLEIYQKNQTSNQVFYVQYRNNGYYSIRAAHSGMYLHKANSGRTDDVHQWSGYGANNTQWAFESAGNGYYYIRSRSGNYLDNSGGRTNLGNNVGTCRKNYTAAQKWKFVPVNKPQFGGSLSNHIKLSGSYNRNDSRQITTNVTMTYPVTKLNVVVYNSSGKNMKMTGTCNPNKKSFSLRHTFNFSGLAAGNYYYRIYCYNALGEKVQTGKFSFSIKNETENNTKNILVSQSEIDNAARNNGISSSTNAYKALLSINTKYYSKLYSNKKDTLIFLFEGVGSNSAASQRMNAMCVVVKNGKIVYLNRNSSTIPDYPFNPSKNDGLAMPTIKSGVYGFTTKNHGGKYAALNITNPDVVRFKSKSSYYYDTSKYINVHRRSSDSISAITNTWVNSQGCQLVGKSGTGATSEYAKFIQAVGIVPAGARGDSAYRTSVSGKIAIDREYATSYLSNVGYSGAAINAIGK